ncbi:protein-glutamate O-methyltransferase [Paralimibaculum aggregatum]|uniref:protein-glutamate O-methyltransferase n=1 Tax=Paralimibaculum aggregatum TaxID=3036245 RepID=A0ABQ6LR77_9RHOB|nr:CheR family methyltransferase [Limibaculum sp. NKW23]GMG83744.1 protein-glutamate O-methyltransferase [Limibaculum sp. NKW23]
MPAAAQALAATAGATLSGPALRALARLAHGEGGLHIGADRADFLAARLGGQLLRLGLADYGAYAAHLARPGNAEDRRLFVEALTTHTTSFFREGGQFDWLRSTGLPALAAAGAGRLRPLEIWSAACSSGQELYSALMTVAGSHGPGQAPLRARGLGTDLSAAILRRAERAIYTREEIEGIPLPLRRRFLMSARDHPDLFRITADLRAQCRWRSANLVAPSDLDGLRADIAFLRNVLIYFDPPTRERVLATVIGRLAPGGVLLTGHTETIAARRYGLATLRPSIYRKEH